MSVNELHPSRSLSLRRGGAGLTPEGCQLDASLRSTGPVGTCDLSPPRPTLTSPPHWRTDVYRLNNKAPPWFSARWSLATLNVLRGQRLLPATRYVQFSRCGCSGSSVTPRAPKSKHLFVP